MTTRKESDMGSGPFTLNRRAMQWSFAPEGQPVAIKNARCGLVVNGKALDWGDAESVTLADRGENEDASGAHHMFSAHLSFPKPGIEWRMDFRVARDGRQLIVDGQVTNRGNEQVTLGQWDLIRVDPARGGRVRVGPGLKDATVFRHEFWNTRAQSLASEGGEHVSQFIGHLHNPRSGRTLSANFITVDRIISEHHFHYQASTGVLAYEAACMLRNHELPPGRSLRAETLVIRAYEDPYEPLKAWAVALQQRYQPKLNPKTTVGWLGWSWVDCLGERGETSEQITLGNAAAIRERLAGFDIEYIWTSQTNLKDMIPGNWLEFDKGNYPHGFENTMKQLMAMEFKPGLWVAPFWMLSEAGPFEENRDNLVHKKDGTLLVNKGGWEFTRVEGKKPNEFHFHYQDGSHPGALAFMRKVFEAYHRMGVRYYMLDFLGCGLERTVHDKSKTWLRADRDLMEEIRTAAGPDTHLLSAVGTTASYTGCVDAGRVNTDFGEGRPLYPRHCLYNATYIVNDKYFGNVRKFLQNAASTYFTHRRLFINDYNLMTVDEPVPRGIAEITATVFGLSGSPIMLGDDIRHISQKRLDLIKLCLPRTDAMAFPVDLFTHVQPDNYSRVLALPVKTAWEEYLLLAVFNLDDTSWTADLPVEQLGLKAATAYRLYEFWNHEYAGPFSDRLTCEVAPNSCKLFRIAKARPHPWLLSTNMHIQQGNVEVTELAWDRKTLTLSGTVTRPRGERGSLYFLMPDKYRLVNYEGHWLMKVGRDNSVVIRRDFHFTKDTLPFELTFAPLRYKPAY